MIRTPRGIFWIAAFVVGALALVFALRHKAPPPPPAPPAAQAPPSAPAGPLRKDFTVAESRSYFVENRYAGRLYVVEGTVTNNLPEPRCRVRIRATLLDGEGREVARQEFEAGSAASISELKLLDWDELEARLRPSGASPCPGVLKPGGSAPFMAVFREPPERAGSFDVVVLDSKQATSDGK